MSDAANSPLRTPQRGARRAAHNTLALLAAKGFDSVVGLVTIGLIARYLGPAQFGIYSFVRAFCSLFMTVVDWGTDTIPTREMSRAPDQAGRYFVAASLLVIGLSLAAGGGVVVGVNLLHVEATTRWALYAGMAAVSTLVLTQVSSSGFRAFERMEYDALKLVLNQAVYLALVVAATRGDWGLASTLWVMAIANLCDIAFGAGILAWKFFAPFSRTDRAAVKHLLREGGSLVIRRLIRTLGLRIDTFILTALKTKRDVGLHGGAYRLILQLRVLPNVLTTVFFPRLSRQWLDSPDQFKATYEQLLRLLVIIALPLVMLLTVLADPITTLVLGNKFLPAGRALMILSWGLGFLFLNSLSMSVLNAMDRQHLGIVAASAALVVNALLDVALIPRWSYLGAAVACTAAEAALLGICTYYITRQVGRTAWAPLIARPAWAALLTSAGLWLLQGLPVLILLPAALVGYGVALIGLRALTAQEIALFREVLGRRQKAEGRKQKAEGTR